MTPGDFLSAGAISVRNRVKEETRDAVLLRVYFTQGAAISKSPSNPCSRISHGSKMSDKIALS
jgi:hypothetical protein